MTGSSSAVRGATQLEFDGCARIGVSDDRPHLEFLTAGWIDHRPVKLASSVTGNAIGTTTSRRSILGRMLEDHCWLVESI